jgi:hypothetical protein
MVRALLLYWHAVELFDPHDIPSVDLPAAKIELRPGFPLSLLANQDALTVFIDALTWFYRQATSNVQSP